MAKKQKPTVHQVDPNETEVGERRQRRWDRRAFIRTGLAVGAGVVASAYVKPSLQSIGIPRAFAQATPAGGRPSIEFNPNDVGDSYSGTTPFTFMGVVDLCNVSGDTFTPISAWTFVVDEILKGEELLDEVVLPDEDFGTLNSPNPSECADFEVTFKLTPLWADADPGAEIKVHIHATGTTAEGAGLAHLTLTLTKA